MCIFSTLIIWELQFKVQTSFEAQNFMLLLSLSLHSSSPTFKLLSMASYGGELFLDPSSPWSGVSSHLFSFSIPLPLNFKKQWTPLMKKIHGLQAPMELHHRDQHGRLHSLSKTQCLSTKTTLDSISSSRDHQVQWHTKTNMVVCTLCRGLHVMEACLWSFYRG